VYAAAVILPNDKRIKGLRDSKLLAPAERERLAGVIRATAIAWSVAYADVSEIDAMNILQATLLAMRRALEGLSVVPDEALVDGDRSPSLPCITHAIVRGDRYVASISAASIMAKVTRDARLVELDREFPQYGFAQHKGYATPEHLAALARHGPCPHHRMSFAPCAQTSFAFD